MIPLADQWGPFRNGLDPGERLARLRSLRALAKVHCGPRAAALVRLLAQAETDETALEPALHALDRLAATDRRHILASYAALARAA